MVLYGTAHLNVCSRNKEEILFFSSLISDQVICHRVLPRILVVVGWQPRQILNVYAWVCAHACTKDIFLSACKWILLCEHTWGCNRTEKLVNEKLEGQISDRAWRFIWIGWTKTKTIISRINNEIKGNDLETRVDENVKLYETGWNTTRIQISVSMNIMTRYVWKTTAFYIDLFVMYLFVL